MARAPGTAYVDVGTLNGYREAIRLLTMGQTGAAAGRERVARAGRRAGAGS